MFRFIQTSRLSVRPWQTGNPWKIGLLSIILLMTLGVFSVSSSSVGAAGLQRSATVVSPILTIGSADILIGNTGSIPITLNDAPTGIGGYAIEITLDAPAVAEITDVVFPGFGLTDITWVSSSHVLLLAADVSGLISPGDTDITLATMTISGLDVGSSSVTASMVSLDDDDGIAITPTVQNGTVKFVNLAPVVDAGQNMAVQHGQAFATAGSFDDSTGESWTATVDYDDISGVQPLSLNGNQFALSHTYAAAGVYTVTVTVTDNFGASGLDSTQVTVVDPKLAVGSADVFVGSSVSVPIILSDAPTGIGGYAIEVTLETPAVAEITDIVFPNFGLTDTTWVSSAKVLLQVADLNDLVSPGDTNITLANIVLSGSEVGSSSITASVLSLVDDAGSALTPAIQNGNISVTNVAPIVDAGVDLVAPEGQAIEGAGSFSDSSGSSWTATVDYGDASDVQPLVLVGNQFELNHTYADDAVYAVTVTITDDYGASGSDSTQVTVTNVSPTVYLDGDTIIENSYTYTGAGSFDDPGSDTWTATVDYGDGTGAQQLPINGKNFSLSHDYAAYGLYRISITVTDNSASIGTAFFDLDIRHVCPLLSGATSPSTDLDGDFKCEDLNGNGRLDFADIVYFFQNLSSPDIESNADDFDFNGNGRLDMDDVVTLFLMVVP